MASKTFGPWLGVNARGLAESQDTKFLNAAVNVDLLSDGSLTERDGLRPVATLDADSVGLYSVGGALRAVIPAGYSKPGSVQGTVPITYDAIGDGTIYSLGTIRRVSSVSSWGADAAVGIYPYLVIERSTGAFEHHFIVDTPVPTVNGAPPPAYIPSNDPVNTKVTLPFTPGESVLKIQEKICAVDNVNGAVRFCSSVFGATDWTTAGDAGFLPVIRHATGDRTIRALSFYDSHMIVAFQDSVQVWDMSPDPARHQLVRVLNGPGLQYPGSIANVRGDLYYFSRGAFSSLKIASISGQFVDGDVGAPISPLTATLTTTTPLSLWSQARSAYYCAFGSTVWRFLTSPTSKVSGWTKYELPVTPSAFVEHLGQLYIRAGNTVYRFEKGYADGSSWNVDFAFWNAGQHGNALWQSLDLVQQGLAQVSGALDPRDPLSYQTYCSLTDSNEALNQLMILDNGPSFSLRLSGTIGAGGASSPWLLSNFMLYYQPSRMRR